MIAAAATRSTMWGRRLPPGLVARRRRHGRNAHDDVEEGRSRGQARDCRGSRGQGHYLSSGRDALAEGEALATPPRKAPARPKRGPRLISSQKKAHVFFEILAFVAMACGLISVGIWQAGNPRQLFPPDAAPPLVYYKGMYPRKLYDSSKDAVVLPHNKMIPPEAIVEDLPPDMVLVDRRKLLEIEEYYTKHPQVENEYATVYENYLPEPFMEGGSCRVGSRIYSSGGFNVTRFFDPQKVDPTTIQLGTDHVFVYDMEDMSVVRGPNLPEEATHIACAYNEEAGLIHLTGGYRPLPQGGDDDDDAEEEEDELNQEGAHRRHWVLDVNVPLGESTWETRADMPLPRGAHGCRFLRDGRMYCVGGGAHNWGPYARDLMIYDPRSDAWEMGPPMDEPREHVQDLETLFDGNALLLVGGRSHLTEGVPEDELHPYFFSDTNSAEIFDLRTKVWRHIRPPLAPRRTIASVAWRRFEEVEPSILLVGGEKSHGFSGHASQALEEFDPHTGLYHCHDPLPFPAHGGLVGVWKDKLHVVGGAEWLGWSGTRRIVVMDLKRMPPPRNCFYRETPVFDEWDRTWNRDPPFPGIFGSTNGMEHQPPMTYAHHEYLFRNFLLNGTAQEGRKPTTSIKRGANGNGNGQERVKQHPVYYKGMHPKELYTSTKDTVVLSHNKMIPPEAVVRRPTKESVVVDRRKLLEIEEYYTKHPQVENKYATVYENHLSEPTAEGGVCRVGSRIYICAGFNTTKFDDFTMPRPFTYQLGTNRMFVYDMEDMSFTRGPDLPGRANHIVCAFNEETGLLHLTGGFRQDAAEGQEQAHRRHWVLDANVPLAEATIENRKKMPLPRGAHGCKFLRDGKMYCAGGGRDQHGPFAKDLMIYDPRSDAWEMGPPMNDPRDHVMDFETLFDGNAILVIGGRSHVTDEFPAKEKHPYFFTTSHSAEVYDIRTKVWRYIRAPPTPRESLVGVSWSRFKDRDQSILLVGGQRYYGYSGHVLNALEEFDPYTGLYHCHDPLPFPVHSPAVGVWDNKLHIVGGAEWLGFASTRRVVVVDLKKMPPPRNCFYRETPVFDEWDRTWDRVPPFPGTFGSTNGMEHQPLMTYAHHEHLFKKYLLKNKSEEEEEGEDDDEGEDD